MIFMKIYLIEFENHDYDEYNSFVVSAENKKDAIKVLKEVIHIEHSIPWTAKYSIKEIKSGGKRRIILGSFNAG